MLSVKSETIEKTESYKDLGTLSGYKLTFNLYSKHLPSKCQQHLYFLCKTMQTSG